MSESPPVLIGRYVLHRQIARGGMATIHIARLIGDEGFSRIVAAKRLHPEFAQDAEFVAMFLDEARVASRVHHQNVVPVLDVVTDGGDVMLVQEYVHGVPLSWLLRTTHEAHAHVPIEIAVSIACQVLGGLHAAHETVDEMGVALDVVHRDVSPQNIMVATDGGARLLDFGVAKAAMSAHVSRDGVFKGKLAYSAPEQVRGAATQQSDLYALCVVLWELLAGRRLHRGASGEAQMIHEIMTGRLTTLTAALADERSDLGATCWAQIRALEPLVMRGLATDARARWATAQELETALTATVAPASTLEVASWVRALGKEFLEGRDRVIAEEEASWRRTAATRAGSDAAGPPTEVERSPVPSSRPRAVVLGLVGACVMIVALLAYVIHTPADTASAAPLVWPSVTASAAPTRDLVSSPNTNANTNANANANLDRSETQSPTATLAATPIASSTPSSDLTATASSSPMPTASPTRSVPPPASPTLVHNSPQRARVVARVVPRVARIALPPPPVAMPAASAAPPPPTLTDCNPPYYFEGAKKIFKPACL